MAVAKFLAILYSGPKWTITQGCVTPAENTPFSALMDAGGIQGREDGAGEAGVQGWAQQRGANNTRLLF